MPTLKQSKKLRPSLSRSACHEVLALQRAEHAFIVHLHRAQEPEKTRTTVSVNKHCCYRVFFGLYTYILTRIEALRSFNKRNKTSGKCTSSASEGSVADKSVQLQLCCLRSPSLNRTWVFSFQKTCTDQGSPLTSTWRFSWSFALPTSTACREPSGRVQHQERMIPGSCKPRLCEPAEEGGRLSIVGQTAVPRTHHQYEKLHRRMESGRPMHRIAPTAIKHTKF